MSDSREAPSFSVVVCAYTMDRWRDLCEVVASLGQQTLPPKQIILVADHNPDLRERMLATFAGTVSVVENQFERGLSGARNSGVLASTADIVAFIDDDAVASPDWLAKLAEAYSGPRVLGVGGVIEPLWADAQPDWFPREFGWVVGCSYEGMPVIPTPVRNLLGCNMSFRRELFSTAGGFRSGLGRIGTNPLGCEETELCIRMLAARPDGIILYQPSARVSHRVPSVRGSYRYFRSRCFSEGLSKAQISRLVGAERGLASERSYTARTLPRGVAASLRRALATGSPAEARRAGAIILGLAFTAAGYIRGSMIPAPAAGEVAFG